LGLLERRERALGDDHGLAGGRQWGGIALHDG
jgi:hypothetical protein